MKSLASRSILTLCCLLITTPAFAQKGSRSNAKATRPAPSSQAGSQRISRPANPESSAIARPANPGNAAVARSRDRVESPRPTARFAGNPNVQGRENSQRGLSGSRTRGGLAERRQNEVNDRPLPETAATGPAQRQDILGRAGMEKPSEAMARGLRNRLAQIERMRDKAIETDNAKLLDLADRLEQDARQKFTDMSQRIAQRQESGKPGVGAPLPNPADGYVPGTDPTLEPIPTEPQSKPVPTEPESEFVSDDAEEVPALDAEPDASAEFEALPVVQP